MRLLKTNQAASTAVRLYEKKTITDTLAGSSGSLEIEIPNKGVYTPNGKSLELWLKRDGAAMRVFAFSEKNSRTILFNRDELELEEGDELIFMEYYGYVDADYLNTQKIMDLQAITDITGAIRLFANGVENSSYLACNGGLVSREDYADLFNIIGTNYGVGDGSTTFELPLLDSAPKIGELYTQFGDSSLPGSSLYDLDGDELNFTDEELTNCLYPGTTWKLIVRNGDFLRQAGTRVNADELIIGSSEVGDTQEDSFQGHYHELPGQIKNTYMSPKGADNSSAGSLWSYTAPDAMEAITDGENGEPRTDMETRPVNTAVNFWVRTGGYCTGSYQYFIRI